MIDPAQSRSRTLSRRARPEENRGKTALLGNRSTQSLALTLVLLLLLYGVSSYAIQRFLRNSARIAPSQRILETLEATLSHAKDAETGQRGYLLTGDAAYLKPYDVAVRTLIQDVQDLRRLIAAADGEAAYRQEQLLRADILERLLDVKMAELQETIALRRTHGMAAALAVVATGRGKDLMDRTREWTGEMERDERLWLQGQTRATAASGRAALLTLTVGGLLGIGLIAAATTLVHRDILARQEAEAALADALQHERRIADALQESFLITPPEDAFHGISIATFYEAAWEEALIGGDFFDVFALEGDRVALVVGDASGKGLAAASRTTEVKYALRAFLREDPDPARALARLNHVLCGAQVLEHRELTFVVVALAVLNTRTDETIFVAAGAEPPLILRAADGAAEAVEARGLPLGIEANAAYPPVTLRLEPDDLILLTTDGITEARQARNVLLGAEGMTRLAQEAQSRRASLRQIGQAILDGARAFTGGALQDDACLLLVRRKPREDPPGTRIRARATSRQAASDASDAAVTAFAVSRGQGIG